MVCPGRWAQCTHPRSNLSNTCFFTFTTIMEVVFRGVVKIFHLGVELYIYMLVITHNYYCNYILYIIVKFNISMLVQLIRHLDSKGKQKSTKNI